MTLWDRSQNLALKIQMSALVSLWYHLCLTQKNRWLEKSTPAMQKKGRSTLIVSYCHHLICPCNGTVIYNMHTFFVAAEVENTNEIFLNLCSILCRTCVWFLLANSWSRRSFSFSAASFRLLWIRSSSSTTQSSADRPSIANRNKLHSNNKKIPKNYKLSRSTVSYTITIR